MLVFLAHPLHLNFGQTFQFYSQDTLNIMYYNLLDFPVSQPDRIDTLKKILSYTKPDVFVVVAYL